MLTLNKARSGDWSRLGKRTPLDFVLRQTSSAEEPLWESEQGVVRLPCTCSLESNRQLAVCCRKPAGAMIQAQAR